MSQKSEFIPAPRKTQLQKQLSKQHPFHAIFGDAFEAVGGRDRLVRWADENYDKFIVLFARMAPRGDGGGSGKVTIQISNQLGPGPLDK